MKFSDFFSKQAREPFGYFGRIIMPFIFDYGNAVLNNFVDELMDIRKDDRVLEIGCGTGKLVRVMGQKIQTGFIEGIDLSAEMVKIAQKKNKRHIASGIVKIVQADFDDYTVTHSGFTKACTVNTIYFWEKPEDTIVKVFRALEPGGYFLIAFEDKEQLAKRHLNQNIFRFYSIKEVKNLLEKSGFTRELKIESIEKKNLKFHCAVARKC